MKNMTVCSFPSLGIISRLGHKIEGNLIQFIHRIHIILQAIGFKCKLCISKRFFLRQLVQIYNIIWLLEDNAGVAFLTTDNKNGIFANIDKNGVGTRLIHTEQEIKIVVHDGFLPKDILHYPRGQ